MSDSNFIQNRRKFFSESPHLTKEFALDSWRLFVPTQMLAYSLATFELAKQTIGIPGHIIAFGKESGAELLFIANLWKTLSPQDRRQFYSFTHSDDSIDENFMSRLLKLHQLDDSIFLKNGKIEESLPVVLDKLAEHPFSYVNLDISLPNTTLLFILQAIWPKLSVGGLITFFDRSGDVFPGDQPVISGFLKPLHGQYRLRTTTLASAPICFIQKRPPDSWSPPFA